MKLCNGSTGGSSTLRSSVTLISHGLPGISIAALQAVRRLLEQLALAPSPPAAAALRYQEACLQRKIAFPSRTAWACHASRVHAYRASTMLVAGISKPLCKACGKLYANLGRLKRHLSASSAYRRGWGAFRPVSDSVGEVHPEAPPGCPR